MNHPASPSYTEFVKSRAKWLPSFAEDLHHAMTGICGEAIELSYAKGPANEREEFGDLEFYIRHAWLALGRWGVQTCHEPYIPANRQGHPLDELVRTAGDLLDMSKKIWIYNKDPALVCIQPALEYFEGCMNEVSAAMGYKRREARADNERKLTLRYPLGYTDAAANLRADKEPDHA